jgi:serine/threonine-protein kinase RsbW
VEFIKLTELKKINLILKSKRDEILKFEKVLEEVNAEFGLEPDRFINFQIAISEALVNAIVHGNKEDVNKTVTVDIEYNETELTIKIKDEGKGFILEKIPDPTNSNNLLKEHGRGIFIIKSFVDKFECNPSDKGTEFILTIVK